MEEKYINSIPGTKEFIFYSFFAAFLNQDVESYEEGLEEFEKTVPQKDKELFAEAIDDFLNLSIAPEEKKEFISELSSGLIETSEAIDVLDNLKDRFTSIF